MNETERLKAENKRLRAALRQVRAYAAETEKQAAEDLDGYACYRNYSQAVDGLRAIRHIVAQSLSRKVEQS